MPHLIDMLWLQLFGALSLGVAVGWLTYRPVAVRWRVRPSQVAIAAVAIAAILLVARLVPARYGTRLDLAVLLAVVFAIGGLVGHALRDIAEFAPVATRPAEMTAAATTGSYLFRDAFTGMGAEAAYMRATSGHGGPARARPVPSNASLAQAPAAGGYTFPRTLPFADATASRPAARPGLRRHWSWPA